MDRVSQCDLGVGRERTEPGYEVEVPAVEGPGVIVASGDSAVRRQSCRRDRRFERGIEYRHAHDSLAVIPRSR